MLRGNWKNLAQNYAARESLENQIHFAMHGVLPKCQGCRHGCFQYNAPNLIYFYCADYKNKIDNK